MTSEQPWYPLATTTWDDAEYSAMQAVIESGRFTMGPKVRRFEEDFARFTGSRYAVMVNSGSSANLLGIAAAAYSPHLGLRRGDEIIVPAVSWATTYYPISQLGFVPVLVDVDPDTLNLDPERVRTAITPRTRAVFAVNLLGNPAELDTLRALCAEHGLLLFEDNCESLGATLGARQTGTFGVFGTYSSFFSHHISTMEGGLVVTDDEYLYQAMLSMRAHGWTRELPAENLIHPKTGDQFDDLFRFVLPGYNLRPLELSGALGIEQLAKLPSLLAGRRENARTFVAEFADVPGVRIQRVAEGADSSWFGFSMVLTGRLAGRRAELVQLLSRAGIESRPIVAGNFARNPVMHHLDARVDGALRAADEIHTDGLFIGNHHYPVPEQIAAVRELVASL
ncbi:DegT/DnrJ/EryC1/StrS family aminotransferase [Agromyces mediolanus]|uniref:DegT/DnrJ/EryC1/StrS family aminotransferase n=1 Tax=Agromyces mediolanus TaxID=41986 RepID=UPI00203E3F57|nr:DegT/DnrJ/EryC1/StrS family aminotransferase [Agromyces mediolanus]MCM3656543.1 DegT/DnrJ/EryC1/StrS family aminotransferase [Agromyces mediolanus]